MFPPATFQPSTLTRAVLVGFATVPFIACGNGASNRDQTQLTTPVGLAECISLGPVAPGSGSVLCEREFVHRAQSLTCRADLARPGDPAYPASRNDAAISSTCFSDDDCRSRDDGFCVLTEDDRLLCAYGCRSDDDCDANELCLCGEGLAGTCVDADCRTDEDCPAGSKCTGPAELTGVVAPHFTCQSENDECAGDADCAFEPCHYRPEIGHRVCAGSGPLP